MTVLYILTAVFAVLGVTEIIGVIICCFTSCKDIGFTLVTTVKRDGDYEMAVIGAIERSKWSCFTPHKILIVTDDLSDEAMNSIHEMISAYPNISVCDKKELGNNCKFLL